MFAFWINIEFITNNKVVLQKQELDKAYKDCAKNKNYAPNFYVEVEFDPITSQQQQTKAAETENTKQAETIVI